jgi:hypothetical protein
MVLLAEGGAERRVEKWPTSKNIAEKREQRRNRRPGAKKEWSTLLPVDFAHQSLWLMIADAWKPASSADQFDKKGRVKNGPSFLSSTYSSLGFCQKVAFTAINLLLGRHRTWFRYAFDMSSRD